MVLVRYRLAILTEYISVVLAYVSAVLVYMCVPWCMGFEPKWRGACSFKARRLNHSATEAPCTIKALVDRTIMLTLFYHERTPIEINLNKCQWNNTSYWNNLNVAHISIRNQYFSIWYYNFFFSTYSTCPCCTYTFNPTSGVDYMRLECLPACPPACLHACGF